MKFENWRAFGDGTVFYLESAGELEKNAIITYMYENCQNSVFLIRLNDLIEVGILDALKYVQKVKLGKIEFYVENGQFSIVKLI